MLPPSLYLKPRISLHLTALLQRWGSAQGSCRTMATGTVKYYSMAKSYGFLVPDDGGADVFVHRSGISSNLPHDQFPRNPFLNVGERVQFDIVTSEDQENGTNRMAANVVWNDGKSIPPLRTSFLGNAYLAIKSELGSHVYDIKSDGGADADERIEVAFQVAHSKIQAVHEKIESVGMKVEDFPTIRILRRGRPVYVFDKRDSTNDTAEDPETL